MDREREQVPASQSENIIQFPQPEKGAPLKSPVEKRELTPEEYLEQLKKDYEESLFHLDRKTLVDAEEERDTLVALKQDKVKNFFSKAMFMLKVPTSETNTITEIENQINFLSSRIKTAKTTKQAYESKLARLSKADDQESRESQEFDKAA